MAQGGMDSPGLQGTFGAMLKRMRMYQAAVALMEEVEMLLARVREQAPKAADHLERSANSVLFNMAEGIGAFRPKIKIASYDIGRREASEVRAALQRLVIKKVLTSSETRKADTFACVCIAMLTNAILSVEKRDD
jgi:four helix bundle protein